MRIYKTNDVRFIVFGIANLKKSYFEGWSEKIEKLGIGKNLYLKYFYKQNKSFFPWFNLVDLYFDWVKVYFL